MERNLMVYPNFSLMNKVAIVTGGGSGIGFEISKVMAINGAKIIIADINQMEGEKAAQRISEEINKAIAIQTNVCDKNSVQNLVKTVYEQFERIDIMVNCAGINIRKPAIEYEEEEWDKILNTNLKGVFLCCQAVGLVMIKQKRGKIINISSILEKIGQELRAPYAASKGGVSQLTKVLAIEWAKYNINVNCIAPGFIRTPLIAELMEKDPKFHLHAKKVIPMGHIGNPEDLSGAVVLLASEASDYITGQSIFIDGGWSIW